jgi:hypothetical protein
MLSTYIPSHSHIPPFAEVRTSPHRQLAQRKSQPWGVAPRNELRPALCWPPQYQLNYATPYFLGIINAYISCWSTGFSGYAHVGLTLRVYSEKHLISESVLEEKYM